jgi:hypothetical protein
LYILRILTTDGIKHVLIVYTSDKVRRTPWEFACVFDYPVQCSWSRWNCPHSGHDIISNRTLIEILQACLSVNFASKPERSTYHNPASQLMGGGWDPIKRSPINRKDTKYDESEHDKPNNDTADVDPDNLSPREWC